jgi:hypothetical protein
MDKNLLIKQLEARGMLLEYKKDELENELELRNNLEQQRERVEREISDLLETIEKLKK